MQVLTTTADLAAFCSRLKSAPFITVDTEFMRERTYYSLLCLVQVASNEEAAIIDPLADGIDLTPLLGLLADKNILKIFHAARQDIEIFYGLMGSVPAPLFDSQIAAMACGYGDQVGYEPLVRAVTGAQVDKGSRFTDWSKRPLSNKQLVYALGDVTHLVHVYTSLTKQLEEDGRAEWIAEEMADILDPALYFTAPENAWKRLKLRNIRPKELGIVMQVAAWRELEAQKRNVPRARVLKDDGIPEIARAAPQSREDLAAMRAIPQGFQNSKYADALLKAVALGKNMPSEDIPEPRQNSSQRSPAPVDVMDLLRVLLKRQSEFHNVAPKLLASASDLEAIALSDEADVPALRGWRRKVFGEAALRLKHGEISLGLANSSVTLIER